MKSNLGIVFFPAFDWMISPTHPERQERLLYTRDQLLEEGIFDLEQIREYKPRLAEISDLQRVHIGIPSISRLITPAHLVSAVGCMTAADAVMSGEVKRAFALVRPPGHHAMRVVHGIRGFCVINIEAIMVAYLRQKYGVRKIAIVDTDVHHGDGTQDIFYHDPDTLYISFHQDGRTLYPGTGFPNEAGSPAALGTNINLPLLPGTGDEGVHRLFDGIIRPILDDFEPEIIINSAGQDNHFSDPLASMSVTAQGYARLADKLKADIAVLEGGYSIKDALPYVNLGICLAMAGCDYSGVKEPDYNPDHLREQPDTLEYIKQLSDEVLDAYFHPPVPLAKKEGLFFVRERKIYYDTEGILEKQREELKDCENCRGYRLIKTESDRILPCLGVEIPADACPLCEKEALAAFAQKDDGYLIGQLIDQKNRRFTYRPES